MARPVFSSGITVRGLPEFRRELRRLDRKFPNELRKIHKEIGDLVARRAAGAAPARASKGRNIRGKGTQRKALVTVGPGRRGDALGVVMGMRRRSGWYSHPRYAISSARQFEPWVGNQWDPGERGGSPYFIGEAINASVDDVINLYGDRIEDLAARAFPSF